MKKSRSRYVFACILLVAIIGAAGVYMLERGISARGEPTAVEAFVARRLRHFAIPRSASDAVNPVQSSPEVLSAAMAHFADHCSICHGNDGRGTSLIGRGLYPKPPDMTQPGTQQLSDGELYYIIENGVRFTGMPGFSDEPANGQDTESWQLVLFIRHLPSITDDEVAQMKKMNPKSPMEVAQEERLRKFLEGEDTPPPESSHEHHH
jgi:mono/diheme cytochrome c family protein